MRWMVVSTALLLVTQSAQAQESGRAKWIAGAALGFSHTTHADLAVIAGDRAYGRANDVGPGALGLTLRAGVVTSFDLELSATGSLAFGGLNLDVIESRYFDDHAQLGSTLTASAEVSPRWAPRLSPSLRLFVGPAAGAQRMAASSPLGFARLDSVGVGLDAGLRLHTNTISRVVDGQLELVLSARRELPIDARVGRSAGDVLFSGVGGGDAIYSFGVSAGYAFGFR